MRYISTRGQTDPVSFLDAVVMGLATDGGLLIPETIPDFRDQLDELSKLSYTDLATQILGVFADDIPKERFAALIADSYGTFDDADTVPLKVLDDKLAILEQFHGPTLAFKDVALQFLGNVFEYLHETRGATFNILGATSGDTGSAAICGVRGKPGIEIFIMHPLGRVSAVQELQMTTVLDDNVHNIAIEGTFDDGQRIMKELFADVAFKDEARLSAINSVNWARIAAQIVYYFHAAFEARKKMADGPLTVSVPTGNFGNILAGWIAVQMGAPIDQLILATNENDILSRYFNTGEYSLGEVAPTLSPSMDIQIASNFERFLYFQLGRDAAKVRQQMAAFAKDGKITPPSAESADFTNIIAGSGSNESTLEIIKATFEEYDYVLDPHTAVAVKVGKELHAADGLLVCLATAHPAKFPDAIRDAIGRDDVGHHPRVDELSGLPTRKVVLPADREAIRQFVSETLASASQG